MNNEVNGVRREAFDELVALLTDVFSKAELSRCNASILADDWARCERDGSHSYGIFRMPGYLSSLENSWVNDNAIPIAEQVSDSYLRIDAANVFAQPAMKAASSHIHDLMANSGSCVVALQDSHHVSALWPDIEPFADAGFVANTVVTGLAYVVPYGGHTPVFSTNPPAFSRRVTDSLTRVKASGQSGLPGHGRSHYRHDAAQFGIRIKRHDGGHYRLCSKETRHD